MEIQARRPATITRHLMRGVVDAVGDRANGAH